MRILLSVLLMSFALSAQAPTEPPPEQIAAMKKLNFMIGEWKGESWTDMGSGKRYSVGTEVIQYKLNDTIITMDGLFKSKDPSAKTVHNAFGVMSFHARADLYRFHAYTANGQMVEARVAMRDNGFDWSFDAGPGVLIRYRMRLDDKGEWVEKGEMTRDGTTRQFFEMRLQKVK
jgi:hypothetical protein